MMTPNLILITLLSVSNSVIGCEPGGLHLMPYEPSHAKEVYCSTDVVRESFLLRHRQHLQEEKIIGMYRKSVMEIHVCFQRRINSSQVPLQSMTGGLMHTLGSLEGSPCPSEFTEVGEYCYLVNYNRISYDDQIAFCASKNGYLAAISSSQENATLVPWIRGLNIQQWELYIGLRDTVGNNEEKDYKWIVDGSDLQFTAWSPNEPNKIGDRCIYIRVLTSFFDFGLWGDMGCPVGLAALCEADRMMKLHPMG